MVCENEDFMIFKENDPCDAALHSLQQDEATCSYITHAVTKSHTNQNQEFKVLFFVNLGYGIFGNHIKLFG